MMKNALMYKGLFSFLFMTILFSAVISSAQPIEVTNLDDAGAGSLRQAIIDANTNPGADEIVFQDGLSGTITLSTGEMEITDALAITGPSDNLVTIDANDASRIFTIDDENDAEDFEVSISNLAFTRANVGGDTGGAIYNNEALTVSSCSFTGGAAQYGAGIYNLGVLTAVSNSVFSGNTANADGAAIYNASEGTVGSISGSVFNNNGGVFGGAIYTNNTIQSIEDCTFSENTGFFGGAVTNSAGTIENISGSTFTQNTATAGGGAVLSLGTTVITNSTFSGNTTDGSGGALYNMGGSLILSFVTAAGNSAGGSGSGVYGDAETDIYIRNSIVAFNPGGSCDAPNIIDSGGNYSDDDTCGFIGDESEIELGPLADNGGPTETIALLGGDPLDGATEDCDALDDEGSPTGVSIGVDQRYFPRPFGPACDSGAFELGPAEVVITKVVIPTGDPTGYSFSSIGFDETPACGITPSFTLAGGESARCPADTGVYEVSETIPDGQIVNIFCPLLPETALVDSLAGTVSFEIDEPSTPVSCIFVNSAADTLVSASAEPPGANCEFGGTRTKLKRPITHVTAKTGCPGSRDRLGPQGLRGNRVSPANRDLPGSPDLRDSLANRENPALPEPRERCSTYPTSPRGRTASSADSR